MSFELQAKLAAEQFPIGRIYEIRSYGAGRINKTFRVRAWRGSFILQSMHRIFSSSLMNDVVAVTAHLTKRDVYTFIPIRTREGIWHLQDGEQWWRMLTYIPGVSYEEKLSAAQLRSAGRFIGIFHSTLQSLEHAFQHRLAGFHDTTAVMQLLRETIALHGDVSQARQLGLLALAVLTRYENISRTVYDVPLRIMHGDLKISNVRFDGFGNARALLDLDTVGQYSVAVELGDMLRSWCSTGGEDDVAAEFDGEVGKQILESYFSSAPFLTKEEKLSILPGVELITLELTARFLTDALQQSYFTLDHTRYASLYEQNRTRAHVQWNLLLDFDRKRSDLERVIYAVVS